MAALRITLGDSIQTEILDNHVSGAISFSDASRLVLWLMHQLRAANDISSLLKTEKCNEPMLSAYKNRSNCIISEISRGQAKRPETKHSKKTNIHAAQLAARGNIFSHCYS